ncbi:hypothetical protein DPMN_096542 [Dreissena polymorpha]|uniref:Uncharacterized protein n=1 Tax=Dreissena polymorpha TaxID=45954 RepID=A0A9D4L8X9_DREPO|nr:hypothetical protein DPMN_096542 [Dreissena polymorpha]
MELRYHTCLSMVQKERNYRSHHLAEKLDKLAENYKRSCMDSAIVTCYSDGWTILALADVVSKPIKLIYPFANKDQEYAYKALNTVFTHDHCDKEAMLTIMWYAMGRVSVRDEYYKVNHFCAVTQQQAPTNSTPVRDDKSDADINEAEVWAVPSKRCITTPKRPRSETSVCSGNRYEVLSDTRPSEEHLDDTMDFEDNIFNNIPSEAIYS